MLPFPANDSVRSLLYASGDATSTPLEETLRVLEEITVTYITDTCLSAAALASSANRAKIKVDDFKFALRRDERKLGRVQELLHMKKVIDDARKLDGLEEGPEDAMLALGKEEVQKSKEDVTESKKKKKKSHKVTKSKSVKSAKSAKSNRSASSAMS